MNTTTVRFKISITEDLLGSWPADPDILTRYISSRAPDPLLQAEEGDSLPKRTPETGLTVFPCDDTGVHLMNYHIKGYLKETGNILKDSLEIKNLRYKIEATVFISPRKIYLMRGDRHIEEPDDVLERPLRAHTAQGPRVTLVASELIKPQCTLEFDIDIVEGLKGEIKPETLCAIMDYGRFKGLGQWRNASYGTFSWERLS